MDNPVKKKPYLKPIFGITAWNCNNLKKNTIIDFRMQSICITAYIVVVGMHLK